MRKYILTELPAWWRSFFPFFVCETATEAMKITVPLSEALATSQTYQWNTQSNGNWRMETKGLCRSLRHVISEGEGADLLQLTFTSPTENVTECQPLPLDKMVPLTAQSYWSPKFLVHSCPSSVPTKTLISVLQNLFSLTYISRLGAEGKRMLYCNSAKWRRDLSGEGLFVYLLLQ